MASYGDTQIILGSSATLSQNLVIRTNLDGSFVIERGDGTDLVTISSTGKVVMPGNQAVRQVAQVVTFQTGTVATGAVIIPHDNTIPQNTEGTLFFGASITPTNASSLLEIDVVFFGQESTNIADSMAVALFKDSAVDAIAVGSAQLQGAPVVGGATCVAFKHIMTAGGTSTTTFNVRAGLNAAGTIVMNGAANGTQVFGGVMSSRITIKEYLP